MWDAGYTRCSCPVVIRGTLPSGKFISLSTRAYLPRERARDMEAARDLALLWERLGRPERPEAYAPIPEPAAAPEPERPSVEMAVSAYMADGRDRGNSEATIRKKRTVFESSLMGFCRNKGIRFLYELNLNTIREWRSGWGLESSLARAKRQEQVLGFLWFCERAAWLPPRTASETTQGLGRIKVQPTQTGYFHPGEYEEIIRATYAYVDGPGNRPSGSPRIRALAELMRWTGLRIRDAVTLRRDRLGFDATTGMWSVMVYQKKTGDPVYCPIPPDVAHALNGLVPTQKRNTNETYFFWTGAGKPIVAVSNWRRSFGRVFAIANLKEPDGTPKRCHPHMFRDTFAVESLLSGMRLEEVSVILGHSSIKITERHYMPWVRARQASLNQSVMNSWIKQGKVQPAAGTGRKAPVVMLPVAAGE
jgi:integrase